MKRREPSAERSSEAPHGLRAQLSRAVGESLDAIRSVLSNNPKPVGASKQRLSDVLWNDRTLLATHQTASARAAQPEPEPQPDEAAAEIAVETEAVQPEHAPELEVASEPADSAGARMRAEARRSEVMRARLEATKARLATRVTAMPKGVAPIAPEASGLSVGEAEPAELRAEPFAPEPPATDPVQAAPQAVAPPPAAVAAREEEEDGGGEEPIRTRSMARLLASQGHRKRALKIYDALLAANGGDAELRAEADALRQAG